MEMQLTNKEIKLIALEAEGVNTYDSNFLEDFSNRAYKLITSRKSNNGFGLSYGYVVRRCYYLVNGKKL